MLMEDSQVNLWWRRPVDRRNLMVVVMMHWWLFHYLFDLAMTRGCCLCVTSWKCASSLSLSLYLSLSLLSRSLFVSLFFYFFPVWLKFSHFPFLCLVSFFVCFLPCVYLLFFWFLVFLGVNREQRLQKDKGKEGGAYILERGKTWWSGIMLLAGYKKGMQFLLITRFCHSDYRYFFGAFTLLKSQFEFLN